MYLSRWEDPSSYKVECALFEYVDEMNACLSSLRHHLSEAQELNNQLNPNNERMRNSIDTLVSLADEVALFLPLFTEQANQSKSFRQFVRDFPVAPLPTFRRKNEEE